MQTMVDAFLYQAHKKTSSAITGDDDATLGRSLADSRA